MRPVAPRWYMRKRRKWLHAQKGCGGLPVGDEDGAGRRSMIVRIGSPRLLHVPLPGDHMQARLLFATTIYCTLTASLDGLIPCHQGDLLLTAGKDLLVKLWKLVGM